MAVEYAKEKGVALWTEAYWDSIRALYLTIGSRVKYYLLKEIGGRTPLIEGGRGSHFELPALRTERAGSELFSLFIPARVLLEVAYVLRIGSGQKSAYQRYLDKARLHKIATFLEGGKSFKNSIVIALDPDSNFRALRNLPGRPANGASPTLGVIRMPRRYASAWIIDGQHRLYGFARVESDELLDESLPVTALKTGGTAEDAETFIEINSNQKSVDSSLLWNLIGELNPNTQKGTISLLVVNLARRKGVFLNKVHIPRESTKSRRHYRIFQSNLCTTISDNLVQGRKNGYPLLLADTAPLKKRQQAARVAASVISTYFSALEALT